MLSRVVFRRVLGARTRLGLATSPLRRHMSSVPPGMHRTSCGLYVQNDLPRSFDKVLIANRGEIACRIMRTCRQTGVRTVAVYSDADANAQHVAMADEAFRVGPAVAKDSYLVMEKILQVAKDSGAQAIHPGYGFLSENEAFATAVEDAGLVFIGPPAEAIRAMGSKSESKKIMTGSGVPVVPGYHGSDQSRERLRAEAEKTGYPVMLKAVLGGGGKGMRIVERPEDFEEMLDACVREAKNAFNDDRVLIERYIQRPRHIEFQVFADGHGNAVHLFERDCSVQRRHQKVLEEAPAPGMSPELRQRMGQSAVDAARAVGYRGAGTVEFIFDAETDEYFFMEMNTRLQVEHCVSEMISKRDFVQWQLHVAAGHELPEVSQDKLYESMEGHAIEARIYAENPSNDFLPATGGLVHLKAPEIDPARADLRVETGVREGDEVSIFYDPMISKLVAWAPDRDRALVRLDEALGQYEIAGVPNNIPFLRRAVMHPAFHKGQVETGFIPEHYDELVPAADSKLTRPRVRAAALAVLARIQHERGDRLEAAIESQTLSPWDTLSPLRVNTAPGAPIRTVVLRTGSLEDDDADNEATGDIVVAVAESEDGSYRMTFPGDVVVDVEGEYDEATGLVQATVDEQAFKATVAFDGSDIYTFAHDHHDVFHVPVAEFSAAGAGDKGAVAPMAGKVVKVMAQAGAKVAKGDALMVMEAMKMEHVIRASQDGVVDKVAFGEGDFVEGGKVLVQFVAEDDE